MSAAQIEAFIAAHTHEKEEPAPTNTALTERLTRMVAKENARRLHR